MEVLSRRGSRIRSSSLLATLALALLVAPKSPAQPASSPPRALADASLEDLMNVEVTSVSRKEQKLSKTGAAVFVITQDDIRRSGAANIPDVLRMAPGVNVARVDANAWAISIRGFNSRYSNKVLVLIDGRSIYSPAFSGVDWDQIDVPLENIERIEIIRGPGGAAWGANAVNGVINIITMTPADTQGGLIVAQAGSQEGGGLTRYGGKAGSLGTWRAFGRYSNTDSSIDPAGAPAADGWHAFHGSFRFDLQPSPGDKVMIQGDLYQSGEGQSLTSVFHNSLPTVATFNDPLTVASGDLQMLWTHTLRNGSETSLNVYYNHVKRNDQGLLQDSTLDLDFQHHIALNSRNDVVWGLGYRVAKDSLTLGRNTQFFPPQRTDSLYSAFVQDEIRLAESASFTVGTKLEHNAYTGFEYEPSARFVWTPTVRQTVWLSASQAIRQPSRQDTDLLYHDLAIIPLGGNSFGILTYTGNKASQAEQLRDYEGGYRAQFTKRLSLDVAVFRSYYRRLETTEQGNPYLAVTPVPPHFVFPIDLVDNGHARTYGGEAFATWNVTNRWRLSPGYSLIHLTPVADPLNPNSSLTGLAGGTPKHQIQFRSGLALRSNLDWDTSIFFVGQLSGQQIPAYTRLDMQLRWRIRERIELGVTGQNLLAPHHAEFVDAYGVNYTQVQRSVFGKITWGF